MSVHSNLLDQLIALVVIILLLSLIVQTVQSACKKLLKIKSRQIEASLLDLFQSVLEQPPAIPPGRLNAMLAASPVLQLIPNFFHALAATLSGSKQPPEVASPAYADANHLCAKTLEVFGQLGRVAQSGKPMLDSLAKEDLLRVLARLQPEHLLGKKPADDLLARMKTAAQDVCTLAAEMDALSKRPELQNEANAQFGDFIAIMIPLREACQDLAASLSGELPALLVEDVLELRQEQVQQAMLLLSSVLKQVEEDRLAAPEESRAPLQQLEDKLRSVALAFGRLQGECTVIKAALQARLDSVEQWFDTVMHSFEERYARGMKTWGLVVAFTVVVWLNANFFQIYHAVAGNDSLRQQIVAQGGEVQQLAQQVDLLAGQAQASGNAAQSQAALATIRDTVKSTRDQMTQEQTVYGSLGFKVLERRQVGDWWKRRHTRGWIGQTATVLAGWLVMMLLLSAGAPFWEDALESLFGLKTIIRGSSATRNVEQDSGAGQPKS